MGPLLKMASSSSTDPWMPDSFSVPQFHFLGQGWWRAWQATVHGVAKSRKWLSDFTFTFHFHALEKETATHSSVLALRIPGMGEPGGLPSMGSHRVGHDWSVLASSSSSRVHSCSVSQEVVSWDLNVFPFRLWGGVPWSDK